MNDYKNLDLSLEDHTAVITLKRPEMMNALNRELTQEFHQVIETIGHKFPQIRAVILTGQGRGFCSGADLSRMASQGSENRRDSVVRGRSGKRIQELAPALRNLPQPVIAAVNGAAVGAGLSIALASDIRIASSGARFSAIFVRRGLVPDTAASSTIMAISGHAVAAEMSLTGLIYDADWAFQNGLVSKVVSSEDLMSEAIALAEEISLNPPLAVQNTKKLMRQVMPDWHDVIANEDDAGDPMYGTKDQLEAVSAFLEKRNPSYTGE